MDKNFTFTEAISFIVNCETQDEVDYYWEKLSEGGDEKAQQCGWLQDKYGVSWQIVPSVLSVIGNDPDPRRSGRVMKTILRIKTAPIATKPPILYLPISRTSSNTEDI